MTDAEVSLAALSSLWQDYSAYEQVELCNDFLEDPDYWAEGLAEVASLSPLGVKAYLVTVCEDVY
jgi:hypothetical protein